MRRLRPTLSCRFFVFLALFSLWAEAEAQPGSLTGSLGGVVVAEREDRESDPQLLIAVPPEQDDAPVDEIRITVPSKIAKRLTVEQIPEGWSLMVKKGRVTLSGPPVEGNAIAIALGLESLGQLGDLEIELYSGGRRLLGGDVPTPSWPKVSTEEPGDGLLDLPEVAAPGDEVTFKPLDPKKTPPGGEWKLDDVPAEWNGDWMKPEYSWKLDADYKLGVDYDLKLSYTDPWGEKLIDGYVPGIPIVPVEEGPPRISNCSPKVLAGGVFCVCGYFPDAASRTGITINGTPLGVPISASSTLLKFRLPASVQPGEFEIAGLPSGGFSEDSRATGVHVGVGGEIDRERLRSGESTPLRLWLLGTDEAISLRLWNESPGISVEGGEDQVVTTSGGDPNEVQRTVHAVSPGDFLINYELTLGSCPCAVEIIETLGATTTGEDSLEPALVSSTESETPCAEDCEELRKTAEALARHADYLEGLVGRLQSDTEWHEEQAGWLDEEVVRDRAEVATRRRFAGEYRDLLEAALEAAKESERRVREFPESGWEESLAYDRKLIAERRAKVEEYERSADALEAAIDGKTKDAGKLRTLIDDTKVAASEARLKAERARLEYEACLAKLPPECKEAVPEALIAEGDDDPRDAPEEEEPKPSYCGPDVSRAYLAALHRVYTRMQSVSDDDKGPMEGSYFLKRNGWSIDQWPFPAVRTTSKGEECPSKLCQKPGNDVQQHCYKLFGYCVPRHSLNDIMYGFTADLVYVPEEIQDWGGNWAEGHYNSSTEEEKKKYSADPAGYLYALWEAPEPEISRRAYRVGDELAEDWDPEDRLSGQEIQELLADGLGDFVKELHKHYAWILDCEDCPEEIVSTQWIRDWSTAAWNLEDGTWQVWDEGVLEVVDTEPEPQPYPELDPDPETD